VPDPPLTLDPQQPRSKGRQIERQPEQLIRSGALPAGARLSTYRILARVLGVNKKTTDRVYRRLRLRGFLEPRQGTGTFVSRKGKSPDKSAPDPLTRWFLETGALEGDARSIQRIAVSDLPLELDRKSRALQIADNSRSSSLEHRKA